MFEKKTVEEYSKEFEEFKEIVSKSQLSEKDANSLAETIKKKM